MSRIRLIEYSAQINLVNTKVDCYMDDSLSRYHSESRSPEKPMNHRSNIITKEV